MNPLLIGALVGGGVLFLTKGKSAAPGFRVEGPTSDSRPQDKDGQITDGAGQDVAKTLPLPITETPSDPGVSAGSQLPVDASKLPDLVIAKSDQQKLAEQATLPGLPATGVVTKEQLEAAQARAVSGAVLSVASQTNLNPIKPLTYEQQQIAAKSLAAVPNATSKLYTPGTIAAASQATCSIGVTKLAYIAACKGCSTSPVTRTTSTTYAKTTLGVHF